MRNGLPIAPRAPCGPDGRAAEEIVIRFVCVKPAHVASSLPEKLGTLVSRSGTCGYCPGQASGAHVWRNNIRVTLADLLKRDTRSTVKNRPPRHARRPRVAPRRRVTSRAGAVR